MANINIKIENPNQVFNVLTQTSAGNTYKLTGGKSKNSPSLVLAFTNALRTVGSDGAGTTAFGQITDGMKNKNGDISFSFEGRTVIVGKNLFGFAQRLFTTTPTDGQLFEVGAVWTAYAQANPPGAGPAPVPNQTFTLTTSPDTATAQIFLAPKAYTPGGNDLVNTLQNEDVLTGNVAAGPTSLTGDLGNRNDSGANIIAPTITNVDAINIAFTSTAADMTLDFQDIAGTETANITRISANLRQSFTNLDNEVVNLGIANTSEQAKATITYLNNELTAANNAVNLTLNNASLADTAIPGIAALRIEATGAQGSELQHQIETFNINTVGRASTIATFETGVSSFDDLVIGERPVTVNINAAVGLSVGTLRWESNRVETNSANGFQAPGTHQVGLNGEGFVDHDQINLITVTGAADVTLANVGNWDTQSDTDTTPNFTLNAAAFTGNLTADISNAAISAQSSVTGGSARDRFYVAVANNNVLATVIGGAGLNDSLTVQSLTSVTVAPGTGSGSVETLNLVQGAASTGATFTTTLNNGFTAVTFNNQAPVNAMTPILTNMNGQLLSVRSQGFNNVSGDPTTDVQGPVAISFTQAAAVVGGTINLELGHASTDRAVTNAFSFANYSSLVSILDLGVQGTTEAARLNLVVNTAGAGGTSAANITVDNGDFETQTTLSSQIAAANTVNIGQRIATDSSDYSTVGANALNSTIYAGGSYLGSQNVTFGGAQKPFINPAPPLSGITTGVAADRVDLSFLTTDVSRTTAGFAASQNLLSTSINMGGGSDELVLSASLADPRPVLVADATYDQYFSNKSGIETLTINNRNNIGTTYVALDGFAFDNNANLATINFADVSGQLALGFRFLNAVTINVDATGATSAVTNQQAAKTTTLNSFSVANNTINVDASEAGNSVVYTSTGANLANTVTLNYNSIDDTSLAVNSTNLTVTTGSLDVVNFASISPAAALGNVMVTTDNSWTALAQTTAYNFASVANNLGTTQSVVTLNATAETNSIGLLITGSIDGTATGGVNNVITGSDDPFAIGFGNDTISSGGFNDTINGLGGNDTITYLNTTANSTVSIDGGAGNDTINFTSGAGATSTVVGGAGNDIIVNLGAGISSINGGTGADSITGGTGNDTITGGQGADVINGGAGTNTFNSADMVVANSDGGTATPTGVVVNLGATTLTSAQILTATGGVLNGSYTAGGTLAVASGATSYLLSGVALGQGLATTQDTLTNIQDVIGSTGADYIVGSAGVNSINGDAGNDTIEGGEGADTITGGTGNDTITGGKGADLLTGGLGNDTFVFAVGDSFASTSQTGGTAIFASGVDVITAFTGGANPQQDSITKPLINTGLQSVNPLGFNVTISGGVVSASQAGAGATDAGIKNFYIGGTWNAGTNTFTYVAGAGQLDYLTFQATIDASQATSISTNAITDITGLFGSAQAIILDNAVFS